LVSLDNALPEKIKKNIIIIYEKRSVLDFFRVIKVILKNFYKKNFFHICNKTFNNSFLTSQKFYEVFKKKRFNLHLSFENKPHQYSVIKIAKEIDQKNKIFGYLAPLPWSFQTDLIYKNCLLDKLYVSSNLQKNLLSKFFLWPYNKIKVINSIRYSILKPRFNTIFVPYYLDNYRIKFYLEKLEYILNKNDFINSFFTVSLHPHRLSDKKHKLFKKKIEQMFKNKKKNYSKRQIPIILGAAGSVVAESLQSIGEVIHISDNENDLFSSFLWKNLKIKNVSKNIYIYKVIKKIKFVKLNSKKNKFKKILLKN
jgi:hypothetical protein